MRKKCKLRIYTCLFDLERIGRKRKAALQVSNQPSKAMHRDDPSTHFRF